jgi:hypothetical protein
VEKLRPGTLALLVLSLPVLVGTFLYGPFVLDLFLHRRPPSRFLIPSGYVGWVRVTYQIPNAPPLPREGKYLLVKVDRDGSLQTSTDLPSGWARDQFFYYSENTRQALSNAGWCKGGMIWGEVAEPDGKLGTIQKFFVGNEDQFRAEVDPGGKMYSPCG